MNVATTLEPVSRDFQRGQRPSIHVAVPVLLHSAMDWTLDGEYSTCPESLDSKDVGSESASTLIATESTQPSCEIEDRQMCHHLLILVMTFVTLCCRRTAWTD